MIEGFDIIGNLIIIPSNLGCLGISPLIHLAKSHMIRASLIQIILNL